jgi:hypothetical protein
LPAIKDRSASVVAIGADRSGRLRIVCGDTEADFSVVNPSGQRWRVGMLEERNV